MNELKKMDKYSCGIYNNCYYKFLNNKVEIYDKHISKINCVGDYYRLICYYCGKYYVVKYDDSDIYILNTSYQEIDKIILKELEENIISLAILNNEIYILVNENIRKFDIHGNFISDELDSINNIYEVKTVELKTLSRCPVLQKRKVVTLTSLGVYNNQLIVAFQKNEASYIGVLINKEIVKTIFICDNSKIISILNVNNNLEFLISKYDSYTYLLHKKCEKCVMKDCSNKPGCDKPGCDKPNIIDSIASIEYSIANLIKTESNKIEEALKKAKNVDELLLINESATKLVKNITLLESVLVEKLETVIDK